MSDLFAKNSHAIPHGQVLAGVARQAKTVHVASGMAWITIEGMPDDFWLHPGDCLSILPGKLVVVEAVKGASRIDIRPDYALAKGAQAKLAPPAIPQWQTQNSLSGDMRARRNKLSCESPAAPAPVRRSCPTSINLQE